VTFTRGLAARIALHTRNVAARPARCAAAAALALAVAAPTLLRAQDVGPDRIAKLDVGSQFTITMLIDSANAEGLPGRVLRLKAYEGIAKKADSRQIVAAVRRELIALRVARVQLGDVDDEELTAAAAVIEAGAKPTQLTAFRARVKNRSDLQAFTTWASLMARGVPTEDASSAISKLWQDGADDATFVSLWNNVQSDILRGLNPGTALQNRIREAPSSGRAPPSKQPPEGQEREGSE
jgi:hypothetical protein